MNVFRKRLKAGFTLIELLVVIAIIAILAAPLGPLSLAMTAFAAGLFIWGCYKTSKA